MGIVSPKILLDTVFGNRHVIATVDFPNHLHILSGHYPASLHLTVENLIYRHTLFPAYAPFIPEERRQSCVKLMGGITHGTIHLSVGVAASKVKQCAILRYCPSCLKNQLHQFGEYYWMRKWQFAGADCCPDHGPLYSSSVARYSYQRHQFTCLQQKNSDTPVAMAHSYESLRTTRFINELLALSSTISPSFEQWSYFYRYLADQSGFCKGKHIQFKEITNLILSQWSKKWLKRHNLYPYNSESCWLKKIFRKHRKSFNYLEHCVVLNSFLPNQSLQGILKSITDIQPSTKSRQRQSALHPSKLTLTYRMDWENLLMQSGPNQTRKSNGALFAWLYRHDRNWLLQTNAEHKQTSPPRKPILDWSARDREIESKLCAIKRQFQFSLTSPRKTQRWYLSTAQYPSTIAKNLLKLPRTKRFLENHTESIALYQCRRILTAKLKLKAEGSPLARWKLLRLSGLTARTMKDFASWFLTRTLQNHGKLPIEENTRKCHNYCHQ